MTDRSDSARFLDCAARVTDASELGAVAGLGYSLLAAHLWCVEHEQDPEQ